MGGHSGGGGRGGRSGGGGGGRGGRGGGAGRFTSVALVAQEKELASQVKKWEKVAAKADHEETKDRQQEVTADRSYFSVMNLYNPSRRIHP